MSSKQITKLYLFEAIYSERSNKWFSSLWMPEDTIFVDTFYFIFIIKSFLSETLISAFLFRTDEFVEMWKFSIEIRIVHIGRLCQIMTDIENKQATT